MAPAKARRIHYLQSNVADADVERLFGAFRFVLLHWVDPAELGRCSNANGRPAYTLVTDTFWGPSLLTCVGPREGSPRCRSMNLHRTGNPWDAFACGDSNGFDTFSFSTTKALRLDIDHGMFATIAKPSIHSQQDFAWVSFVPSFDPCADCGDS